jgi:hypothetical protein
MIMMDQSRRLKEPLRWGRRERAVVGALLVCVVAIVVGLGAYAATSGGRPRKDCVEVTFASTLGGATEHACGGKAREVCASPQAFKHVEAELRESCRRAGFPFD